MDAKWASEVDLSKIAYGAPTALQSGAKHIRLSYERGMFLVQTPDMYVPFGINKWETPGTPVIKYSIDLSFKDVEMRPDVHEFKEMLKNLDSKLVDDAFSGKLASHNKKFANRDVVEVLYTPLIKQRDEKFPPNFKVTLPLGPNGEFTFPTYMVNPKTKEVVRDEVTGKEMKVDLQELIASGSTKRATCSVIMQCSGVWVAGGSNFGCTWKVVQMRIMPVNNSREEYAFRGTHCLMDPSLEQDLNAVNLTEDDDVVGNNNGNGDDDDKSVGGDDDVDEDDPLEVPVTPAPAAAAGKATAVKGRGKGAAK